MHWKMKCDSYFFGNGGRLKVNGKSSSPYISKHNKTKMRGIVLLAFLLAIVSATVVPRVTPIKSHVPRTYKVSLDDPPLKRWAPLVHDYMEPLKRFMNYIDLLPIPSTFYEGV